MKKILNKIPEFILLPIMSVMFLATWPFMVLFVWVKSLFSNKINDSEKVEVTKEVLVIFGIFIVAGLLYYFLGDHSGY